MNQLKDEIAELRRQNERLKSYRPEKDYGWLSTAQWEILKRFAECDESNPLLAPLTDIASWRGIWKGAADRHVGVLVNFGFLRITDNSVCSVTPEGRARFRQLQKQK